VKDNREELSNLEKFKEKITEVSKSDKENFIESDIEIINFDKVKEVYCNERKLNEVPSSNDGLYISKDKKVIFIEFKNAKAEVIKEYDLGKKNYDSVCILSDILDISIRELRRRTKYVLVYSSEKNSIIDFGEALLKKNSPPNNELESKKKNCFGQKKFLNYLYYAVEAINDKEFKEKYLDKEII
jgi:hypothetical protein